MLRKLVIQNLLIESTSQGYVLSCPVLSSQVLCFLCVVFEGLVETARDSDKSVGL